jgi:chemotaxis protein MotA
VFTPLAGRLEHHNHIFLECHKQLLAKIGILMKRDDRSMETIREGAVA